MQKKQEKKPEKLDDIIQKLHQRFEGAIRFLKETSLNNIDQRTKLFNLPWFLLLGFHDSGKTSLLTHSQLDFILSKKNHSEKPRMSHCEWWATRETVFLDVNNGYTIQSRKDKQQRKLWFDFLELLRQHRRQKLVDGVIFCIDIDKLCTTNKAERNAYFHSVRGRLKDLASYARMAFPVYFVINKADKLSGFLDFFDHLNKDEARQLWGMLFNQAQTHSSQALADAFDLEYDKLLDQLNQRVIYRLHHERNLNKRALIKDFPLQVESIKKPLAAFLQNMADTLGANQPCQLRGIYFCAAMPQENVAVDRLLQPLTQIFSLQNLLPVTENQIHRPYFTHDIFQQLLRDKNLTLSYNQQTQHKFKLGMQWVAVGVCSLFVVSMIYGWIHSFSKNIADLSKMEQALAQYQLLASNTNTVNMHQTLAQLDRLSLAKSQSKHAVMPWVMRTFMKQDMAIYDKANQAFIQTIQTIIQRQLQQILEMQLKQGVNSASDKMYGTLRAYLMLFEPQFFNKDYIVGWLDRYWLQTDQLGEKEIQQINKYLMVALSQPLNLRANNQLIDATRAKLNNLSQPILIKALIEAGTVTNSLTLQLPAVEDHLVFTAPVTQITIPAAYRVDQFAHVYDSVSLQVADALTNGDWVLRNQIKKGPVSPQLVEKVRQFYIENYVELWRTVLSGLQIAPFNSYKQGAQVIATFTQPNSPTLKLIYEIAANTKVYYRNAPTPISLQFSAFHNSVNQILATSHDNLQQLGGYLVSLQQNVNASMAAIELAKSHKLLQDQQGDAFYQLTTQAQKAPFPCNVWLTQLLQNSWNLILQDAQKGINQAWTDNVYSDFQNKIVSFYPFNKAAAQDVAMEEFSTFFARSGTLDSFITTYLAPFVDLQQKPWALTSFNGAVLPISSESLIALQRAAAIRDTFFNKQNAPAQIQFLLKPTMLSPETKMVDLSIDSQSAQYNDEFKAPTRFEWPGKEKTHFVAMVFTGKDDTQTSATMTGPWALFHWLDSANPQLNGEQLSLNYQAAPYAFEFDVLSDQTNNPFTLNLLHGYTIPASL